MEKEGGGFGLKINTARSIILIALDVHSKLWPDAMEGQPSLSVLASPVLSPCSWKEFSMLAFWEELPQAFSLGSQSQGRGSHFLAAKGEGLLRQHLICWLLFWQPTPNYWFEPVDQKWGLELQRDLLFIPGRNGMIWRSSVHTFSEELSLYFPQGQENVRHCLIHQYFSRLWRKTEQLNESVGQGIHSNRSQCSLCLPTCKLANSKHRCGNI